MRPRRAIPSWLPTLLVAILLFVAISWAKSTDRITVYWFQVIQLAAITAISALGLNLIYGFNGQFSLGQIGFYAIGAYGSALVTKDFMATWSGSRVGALSWIMAAQLGLVVSLAMIRGLRLGERRKTVRAWAMHYLRSHEAQMILPFPRSLRFLPLRVMHYLRSHEAQTITAVFSLLTLAVIIAIGAAVAWVLHKGLLALLTATLLRLPQETARPIIFALALLNGGTMAGLVSYLVGLPLLRLGSDYFGIATLGFAIMVYTALQNSDMVVETMKGARGMVAIPRWTNWGWVFAALVVALILMRNLIYSSHGRAIKSVREDEIAAQSMGIDVTRMKAVAFAFGGFFAGIAGGLYAHLYGFLHPSTFSLVRGFDPLIIIVFGGLGSMTGTVVASAMFALVIEGLRVVLPQGFEDWRFVIYPVLLLLVMLLRQQGLLGTSEWGWLRAPLPPERDIPVPARQPATPQVVAATIEEEISHA